MDWQLEADNSIFSSQTYAEVQERFLLYSCLKTYQDQILALGAPSQQETCTCREHLTFLFFKLVQRYLLRGCKIQSVHQEFWEKK